jgi:hypothetical protein
MLLPLQLMYCSLPVGSWVLFFHSLWESGCCCTLYVMIVYRDSSVIRAVAQKIARLPLLLVVNGMSL